MSNVQALIYGGMRDGEIILIPAVAIAADSIVLCESRQSGHAHVAYACELNPADHGPPWRLVYQPGSDV